MNAVVATLYFILQNCVMFRVSDTVLNKELVDLGLPKGILSKYAENVESITKTYKSSRDKLIEISLEKSFASKGFVMQFPKMLEFVIQFMSLWAAHL